MIHKWTLLVALSLALGWGCDSGDDDGGEAEAGAGGEALAGSGGGEAVAGTSGEAGAEAGASGEAGSGGEAGSDGAPVDPLTCRQEDFGYGPIWVGDVESEAIGPEPESMRGITEAHNVVRRFVGVPDLTWSEALAEGAQGWADDLAGRDCAFEHTPQNVLQGKGENLAMGGGSGGATMSIAEAISGWACEREDWDNEALTCNGEVGFGVSPRPCGHYTQLVWRDTTEVGCGWATCEQQGMTLKVWVCRYNPGGNYMNPNGTPLPPY